MEVDRNTAMAVLQEAVLGGVLVGLVVLVRASTAALRQGSKAKAKVPGGMAEATQCRSRSSSHSV